MNAAALSGAARPAAQAFGRHEFRQTEGDVRGDHRMRPFGIMQ
jgi:hypothetical protein